ncbi:hypothetical protein ACWDN9_03325, partial [Streptomyces nigra]
HYRAEAQTLTTGAEANLLKLAELRGTLTAAQATRWAEVKAAYVRTQALGGAEDDQLARAVAALGLLADRIAAVESAITRRQVTGATSNAGIAPTSRGAGHCATSHEGAAADHA